MGHVFINRKYKIQKVHPRGIVNTELKSNSTEVRKWGGGESNFLPPPPKDLSLYISELSFIEKGPGFVQTRDQELSIALFKSIKLQFTKNLELTYIHFVLRVLLI